MQALRQDGRKNHQIYPSGNGISYRITGKDGKREGFIRYGSVDSIYVESMERQSKYTFLWLAMLVVILFIAMTSLDGFLMKTIALCLFSLMGSFLLFDHYSQANRSCLVIQTNGMATKFRLGKNLSNHQLEQLMEDLLGHIDANTSLESKSERIFIPR